MGIENPVHLIFLAAVVLLVLGPRRLPEVARSLGKGIREFRDAMSEESAGARPELPSSGHDSSCDPGPGSRARGARRHGFAGRSGLACTFGRCA